MGRESLSCTRLYPSVSRKMAPNSTRVPVTAGRGTAKAMGTVRPHHQPQGPEQQPGGQDAQAQPQGQGAHGGEQGLDHQDPGDVAFLHAQDVVKAQSPFSGA